MDVFRAAFTADFLSPEGKCVYPPGTLEVPAEAQWVTFEFLRDDNAVVRAEQIQGINALGVGGAGITAATFSQGADDLAFICRFGAGYDDVDLAACTAAAVAVANTPGANGHMVAAGALTLILSLSYRLLDKRRLVYQGRWDLRADVIGTDIRKKVLGIVGLGQIGRELIRLVRPFDMRVLAYDPQVDALIAERLGVELVSLEDLLSSADFVSLHCSLTPTTRRLIGARELRLMKPTAYLISMARGMVVDQEAVTQALAERWIAGAGLDVFEVEPLPAGDPLTRLDNVILTPHGLSDTHEAFAAVGKMGVSEILRVARGQAPEHILNPEVLEDAVFHAKLGKFRSWMLDSSTVRAR